jgi:AcrR family transcriptional regulator
MTPVKSSTAAVPSRRERAKATQARIVKAAYDLFVSRGYASTTIAEIADAAGVAVQTVYFTFHTKPALLSRAYDSAVMGEGQPLAPDQQPWYGAMVAEAKVTAALRHLVTGVGEITRRVTPLFLVARAAAESDAETARVMSFHETWRAEGYRQMLDLLRAKAPLRSGVSPERATQLLLLYAGPDVYHVLVDDYGWTLEEWVEWTVATLDEQLFGCAEHPPFLAETDRSDTARQGEQGLGDSA